MTYYTLFGDTFFELEIYDKVEGDELQEFFEGIDVFVKKEWRFVPTGNDEIKYTLELKSTNEEEDSFSVSIYNRNLEEIWSKSFEDIFSAYSFYDTMKSHHVHNFIVNCILSLNDPNQDKDFALLRFNKLLVDYFNKVNSGNPINIRVNYNYD